MGEAAKDFEKEAPSASHPVTPRELKQLSLRMMVGMAVLAVLTVGSAIYIGANALRAARVHCDDDTACQGSIPDNCNRCRCNQTKHVCEYYDCH